MAKYADWDVKTMRAIAQAESNCRVDAKGDLALTYETAGRVYGYSVGPLQVRILPGRDACDSYSLEVNVKCAHAIWQSQGYEAWAQWSNGSYHQFL